MQNRAHGAHSNAYTSADTVNYNISFQNPSPSRLEKIFDIMSQRTLHMVFDAEEVELERGVVLSEKQAFLLCRKIDKYLHQADNELQTTTSQLNRVTLSIVSHGGKPTSIVFMYIPLG
jgi:hypothetical protein